MKLSDFVVDFLAREGIRHIFLVSGGAVVHLVDSVARHPQLSYVCTQHEQGAGTAADGYARISGFGTAFVTSGPGPTNLVTSIANLYYDSIPAIFICGQVATFRIKSRIKLRQKGFQETDVISIFRPITKYVAQIKNSSRIKYELQKAVYLAQEGRKGPVVLDIPDDIQRVEINPARLPSFSPDKHGIYYQSSFSEGPAARHPSVVSGKTPHQKGTWLASPTPGSARNIRIKLKKLFSLIDLSKRPVLILGAGVRLSGTEKEALQFARYFNLPILLTWGGMDLIPYRDELNMGGIGVCGPRGGNFAVQKSDLVIAIGTRLSQLITGGKQNLFAKDAKKIMIDVDIEELNKFTPDIFSLKLKIKTNLADFFQVCSLHYLKSYSDRFDGWREQIKSWRKDYPICPKKYYRHKENVNPYVFIKELSKRVKPYALIAADTGANLAWTMQAFETKLGQRIFSAWSHTPMGYSLPAAIGAACASSSDVICLIGDGGLMMCLSELATVVRYKLPIKIFIFNNHGHSIQRQTLDTWLNSRYVAVDEKSGLSFPDFKKVGKAFGLPVISIGNHSQLGKISDVLAYPGPIVCNVEIDPKQKIVPMLKFGKGLEDLDPPLPGKENI